MGCAVHLEHETLTLNSFGAYSNRDGGTYIELFIKVPRGIEIEKSSELSSLKYHEEFGPDASESKWTIVPDHPIKAVRLD